MFSIPSFVSSLSWTPSGLYTIVEVHTFHQIHIFLKQKKYIDISTSFTLFESSFVFVITFPALFWCGGSVFHYLTYLLLESSPHSKVYSYCISFPNIAPVSLRTSRLASSLRSSVHVFTSGVGWGEKSKYANPFHLYIPK